MIGKRPLLELEPYPDEFDYMEFCIRLSEIIRKRFTTGYVKCRAENIGWQRRSGYKVFKCDITQDSVRLGESFLANFMPNCDWSATVYTLNKGKGLYFSVSHHDAQGESYYLSHITERTYERLL